jgi:hypothetical protein
MSHQNYRLVSLWDMLEHRAAAFYSASVALASLHAMLQSDMATKPYETMEADSPLIALWRMNADELSDELHNLGCSMTLLEADRLLQMVSGNSYLTPAMLSDSLEKVRSRLVDELRSINFFAIEPSKAHYFKQSEPLMGQEVAAKFASLSYDIEEAGKCMALSRSTAAAFHALRSLEAGIAAMSRCLGIPDPTRGAERNWNSLLEKIKKAIDLKWPKASDRFAGDGALFEGLYAVLVALQNPYRNATMHFDQKYTEDEAKHVFEMVSGVMRKIASRMDENGLPLA